MATIRKVQRKKGVGYKAIIKKNGIIMKCKTFNRKTDARAWAARVEADNDLMAALGSRGAKMTFYELCDEYMFNWEGKNPGQSKLVGFWEKRIGNYKLKDINVDLVRDLITDLKNGRCLRGDGRGKSVETLRKRKPATINRYKAVLSGIFQFAITQGYVVDNPARKVPYLKFRNERPRFLSDLERKQLLEACRESSWDKLYLLVLMAMTTGMRRSELINLRWCDIDFDSSLVYLATTKNGEPRCNPIPSKTMEELRVFRQVGSGLVFPSDIKPDQPLEFRKHWLKVLKDSGIKNFIFHSLRHDFCSQLTMHGATLAEVAELAGHKSLQTTKRYAHLSTEHKSKLAERVMSKILDV